MKISKVLLGVMCILQLTLPSVLLAQTSADDWAAFDTANKEAARLKLSLVGRQIIVSSHNRLENECLDKFMPQQSRAELRRKLEGRTYLVFRYANLDKDRMARDFCVFIDGKENSLIAIEIY